MPKPTPKFHSLEDIRSQLTRPQFIALDKDTYDRFMYDIRSLHPKKRRLWKDYLTDKWGQKTRCKYRNGKIYNWSLLAKEWQEVIVPDLEKTEPTSRLGRMLSAGIPRQLAFELEIAMNKYEENQP